MGRSEEIEVESNTFDGSPPETRFRDLLYRTALGHSVEEIAQDLNMSPKAARDVMASPFMREELRKVRQTVRAEVRAIASGDAVERELKAGALQAAQTMVSLTDDPNPNIALKASKEVLDKTGHGSSEKVEHQHTLQLPEAQAAVLLETMEILRSRGEDPEREARLIPAEVVERSPA